MNKTKLKIIIVFMSFAVIGLVAIQVYWILRMYNSEKLRFSNYVNESLIAVSEKLEKREIAKIFLDKTNSAPPKIFAWNSENDDSNSTKTNLSISVNGERKQKYNVIIDSNETPGIKYNYSYSDSNDFEDVKFIIKIDSILDNKRTIVKEVVTEFINVKMKDSTSKAADIVFIDSIFTAELAERGIDLDYNIEINSSNKIIRKAKNSDDQLIFSAWLFPNDVVPNNTLVQVSFKDRTKYFLETIGLMLFLSVLFISIVVVVFYQTVRMLIRQKKITDIKNDLINNITHEFKTPISTISLACEALNEPDLSREKSLFEKYTEMIKYENNRLRLLVENLLNTAIRENDKIEIKKSEVNLNEIISNVISGFHEKIKETNGKINLTFEEEIIIKADEFHLMNIFNNLIDNAIKYCKEIPVIEIILKKERKFVLIYIKDNGIGISKKNIQHIFDPFFRVPTGNIHDVKGFGIGLNYVKKFVEAHNGNIIVDSKLEKGTTFQIRFPYE